MSSTSRGSFYKLSQWRILSSSNEFSRIFYDVIETSNISLLPYEEFFRMFYCFSKGRFLICHRATISAISHIWGFFSASLHPHNSLMFTPHKPNFFIIGGCRPSTITPTSRWTYRLHINVSIYRQKEYTASLLFMYTHTLSYIVFHCCYYIKRGFSFFAITLLTCKCIKKRTAHSKGTSLLLIHQFQQKLTSAFQSQDIIIIITIVFLLRDKRRNIKQLVYISNKREYVKL